MAHQWYFIPLNIWRCSTCGTVTNGSEVNQPPDWYRATCYCSACLPKKKRVTCEQKVTHAVMED